MPSMTPLLSTLLLDKASVLAPELQSFQIRQQQQQHQQHHHHQQQQFQSQNQSNYRRRRNLRGAPTTPGFDGITNTNRNSGGRNTYEYQNENNNVCTDLEALLGIQDNIMDHAATADEFLLCKCNSSPNRHGDTSSSSRIDTGSTATATAAASTTPSEVVVSDVSITCLFPTICDNYQDMDCASLTLNFDFDTSHGILHAGACIDYSMDEDLEETCIQLEITLGGRDGGDEENNNNNNNNNNNFLVDNNNRNNNNYELLTISDNCLATYGGNECHRCDVDTVSMCMNMDCSEWNESVVSDGCQPLGIVPGQRLEPSRFVPSFQRKENEASTEEVDNDMTTSDGDKGEEEGGGKDMEDRIYQNSSSGGLSLSNSNMRLAISNSVVFLFNLVRHYVL